jgi:SAM-dependent methyltransferase
VAHSILYEFVADLTRTIDFPDPVVEFGSLQVEEGQPNDVRPLFSGKSFTGTDFRSGPGVDRVEDLRSLTYADGEIGSALCLDTLEHCADPLTACKEMHRVLRDGGVCVITSVMLIGVHAHPNDYFRFTPEGFRSLLEPFDDVDVASWGDPENPFFVFAAGVKKGKLGVRLNELPRLSAAQREYTEAEGRIRVGPFRYSLRDMAGVLRDELPRVVRQRARARLGR